MNKPIVAIIGRQNVGKSTLFNRLTSKRLAIVEDLPGTTRDRIMADISWQGTDFIIVDTGGLELAPQTRVTEAVQRQVEIAIDEADVIIFLTDIKSGVTPADLETADKLRLANKPLILAANKADNPRLEFQLPEFYELGLGDPLAISAYHARGTDELLDRIVALLPATVPPSAAGAEAIKIAIVGRPNVGKSMLLNALLGREQAITDDTPGTTRDAIDTALDFEGQSMILIDTAGIKRRGRIGEGVERYSALRALRAINRADIVLIVLDVTELVTAQDMHIVGYAQQATKGIILVVNKWDLVVDRSTTEFDRYIRHQLKFITYAPILRVSAKFGQGVDRLLPEVGTVYQERLKRVATSTVNEVVQQAIAAHNTPRHGNKRLKFLYATQATTNPPTFVFFVNDAKLIHFSYRRYLENKLRDAFGFVGNPLSMTFKSRGEK